MRRIKKEAPGEKKNLINIYIYLIISIKITVYIQL